MTQGTTTTGRSGGNGDAGPRRPQRGARRRRSRAGGRGGRWLLVLVLVGLCSGGGYWAYQAGLLDRRTLARLPIPGLQAPASQELTLYFADPRWTRLAPELRQVSAPGGAVATLHAVVAALAEGPREGHAAVLPASTRLRGAYLGRDGLAVLDFEEELERFYPGGASGEVLTVFAVVNSVAANVPGVERVQLLIGGSERETLAGHVKISEPLAPDPQWLQPAPR